MQGSKSREDYLEVIFLLSKDLAHVHQIDIARYMGVSQPAVEKAVRLLVSSGYLKMDGLHIILTPEGEEYASRIYERHSTICNFLAMHGVDEDAADRDASEIEHFLSDESFEMMSSWIRENKKEIGWVCPLTGHICVKEDCDNPDCENRRRA
ncbi:MAG: metal-dependent transcriptional regulator [Clostridia bacterium]|nr:metal-dependent transcriptional regulator [Clostridia bacterium]